jgi:hypothetical protein
MCKDSCTNAEASCRTAQNADAAACAAVRSSCQGSPNDPITDPNISSSSSSASASSSSAAASSSVSKTLSSVIAVSTGGYTYVNGSAVVGGKNATSTYTPLTYTGAASKAGVSAALAGVFGIAAYLL